MAHQKPGKSTPESKTLTTDDSNLSTTIATNNVTIYDRIDYLTIVDVPKQVAIGDTAVEKRALPV